MALVAIRVVVAMVGLMRTRRPLHVYHVNKNHKALNRNQSRSPPESQPNIRWPHLQHRGQDR